MMPCFYKKFLGVECPGCGMQRSIIALLRGDFYESFMLYPALPLIITLIILLIVHLIFKLKYGAMAIKWLFVLTTAVIIISFILKLTQEKVACCPH